MALRRTVQNGDVHAVVHDLQDARTKVPRVECNRLARLQIHLHAVAICEPLDGLLQESNIVARLGDMVPAAEIEPLHLRKIRPELALERRDGRRQVLGALLAERVEMQTLHPAQKLGAEVLLGDAEAGEGRAGVVDAAALRGELRIDAQSDARMLCPARKLFQLAEGVEYDMIADGRDLVKLVLQIGRTKDMIFAPEVLVREPGFIQSARRRAAYIRRDERIEIIAGERLLREQNFTARTHLDRAQDLQIVKERVLVDDVDGRGKFANFHQSTGTGFSTTFQGSPYLLSASM